MNLPDTPPRSAEHLLIYVASSRNIKISNQEQIRTDLSLHTADEVSVTAVGNNDQTELSLFTVNLLDTPLRADGLLSTSAASSRNRQTTSGEQRQTELSFHTADEVDVTMVGNNDQTELSLFTVNLTDTPLRAAELLSTSVASSRNRKTSVKTNVN